MLKQYLQQYQKNYCYYMVYANRNEPYRYMNKQRYEQKLGKLEHL